jgi:hypothetical protein
MTFKAWKDRAEQLQQDLGELAARDRTGTDRFQVLMSLLRDHVAKEPQKDRQEDNGLIFGHADTVEETRLMLEATDEALDEIDGESEDEEQRAETSTSGNRLRTNVAAFWTNERTFLMVSTLQEVTNPGLFGYT